MEKRLFPLSAITKRISELLEPAINKQFWVKAEISSGRERGGAFYCELIETDPAGKIVAKISCNIWQRELASIRELFKSNNMDLVLENGTVVGFLCSLRYSPQYGLSLTVIDADPSFAMGEMELKKRAIIELLQREGLFQPNKDRFVPMLPLRVGLVTSAGSAAYNDVIETLSNSGCGFRVYLADAMMQGDQAERSVIRAIDALCKLNVELIIVARGGGSKTDLYYLDNEAIARKIAACPFPVWSGIGHEIDTSVLDYVANRSFKTPTAVAEELVARFVQMRRQLDESATTLKTVWSYNLKMEKEFIARSLTGIQQGSRKLLDVTSSNLREQANKLRLHVTSRISTEQRRNVGWKEQLRARPLSRLKSGTERLMAKKEKLKSQARFTFSRSSSTFAGIKQRFDRDRFLRLISTSRECNGRNLTLLKSRFAAILDYKRMQRQHLKDRFRVEMVQQRIGFEAKNLINKFAILKASDPQNVLKRGFAIVHRKDGRLIRSIHDVTENEKIYTHFTDGFVISEVISKENKRE